MTEIFIKNRKTQILTCIGSYVRANELSYLKISTSKKSDWRFRRRSWKCEKLTDGRTTTDNQLYQKLRVGDSGAKNRKTQILTWIGSYVRANGLSYLKISTSKKSDWQFRRRSRKCCFWSKMTKIFIEKKKKTQILAWIGSYVIANGLSYLKMSTSKKSDKRFRRRNRKCNFWPKMTKIFIKNRKMQILTWFGSYVRANGLSYLKMSTSKKSDKRFRRRSRKCHFNDRNINQK